MFDFAKGIISSSFFSTRLQLRLSYTQGSMEWNGKIPEARRTRNVGAPRSREHWEKGLGVKAMARGKLKGEGVTQRWVQLKLKALRAFLGTGGLDG